MILLTGHKLILLEKRVVKEWQAIIGIHSMPAHCRVIRSTHGATLIQEGWEMAGPTPPPPGAIQRPYVTPHSGGGHSPPIRLCGPRQHLPLTPANKTLPMSYRTSRIHNYSLSSYNYIQLPIAITRTTQSTHHPETGTAPYDHPHLTLTHSLRVSTLIPHT